MGHVKNRTRWGVFTGKMYNSGFFCRQSSRGHRVFFAQKTVETVDFLPQFCYTIHKMGAKGVLAIRELSLNVMDVVQNSITAGSPVTTIAIEEDTADHTMVIRIIDQGKGMTPEQVEQVTNPFFTTRTTRSVGLGVPFFKMSSEQTGGDFSIESQAGAGTTVTARYRTDHIDMTPLGDINETVLLLIISNPVLDFVFRRERDGRSFALDTREMREVLGEDVDLSDPDIAMWLREYLAEQEGALLGAAE